jgi:1,2-dihydroxy-3-keto-5-methylthiopentene dioxygenase
MSLLRIFPEDGPGSPEDVLESSRIAQVLEENGIQFQRWVADRPLALHATQAEILAAYDRPVQALMKERGFVTADVISVNAETPNHPELRKKFLDEHTHSEDEARFFVEGSGVFYIHSRGRVYAALCEKGDFINLPRRTRHWFDFGPRPHLKVIRTFTSPEGWVAEYTGSDIAARFPRFDAIAPAPSGARIAV